MIFYVEKKVKDLKYTNNILSLFPNSPIYLIDSYKNIFDIKLAWTIQKVFVIASVKNPLVDAPLNYGYKWKWFFLRNSLNCVYDCSYCYLQWIFKNNINIFFINYDFMKESIIERISEYWPNIWFYSSDYSDNFATARFSWFLDEFIPFFSSHDGIKMEIRTKSSDVSILDAFTPHKNIEIAFSLNPQEVIDIYEKWTPSLKARLASISYLLDKWWQVGIRFMPLISCFNYHKIYTRFLDEILQEIDFHKVYSVFIWWILYTDSDYKIIIKKKRDMDILYDLSKSEDGFYRQSIEIRKWFYHLFKDKISSQKHVNICFDDF